MLALAPATDVTRYLANAGRTEISAVGYADGAQPVSLVAVEGGAPSGPMQRQSFWSRLSTGSVEWNPDGATPTSLVVMRTDGAADLDVTLTVARDAGWITTVTWAMFVAGVLGVLGGLALLFWPATKREMVLVLEAHRMVDFADRIAERLGGTKRGKTDVVRRMPAHDLTGELIPITSSSFDANDRRRRRDEPGAAGRDRAGQGDEGRDEQGHAGQGHDEQGHDEQGPTTRAVGLTSAGTAAGTSEAGTSRAGTSRAGTTAVAGAIGVRLTGNRVHTAATTPPRPGARTSRKRLSVTATPRDASRSSGSPAATCRQQPARPGDRWSLLGREQPVRASRGRPRERQSGPDAARLR